MYNKLYNIIAQDHQKKEFQSYWDTRNKELE